MGAGWGTLCIPVHSLRTRGCSILTEYHATMPCTPASTQSVEHCNLSEETKAALKKVWTGDTSELKM